MNGDAPLVVTNQNDPVRIVNAVGTILSPILLAYIAAFGSPIAKSPANEVAKPQVTIQDVLDRIDALNKPLTEISAKLDKLTPQKK